MERKLKFSNGPYLYHVLVSISTVSASWILEHEKHQNLFIATLKNFPLNIVNNPSNCSEDIHVGHIDHEPLVIILGQPQVNYVTFQRFNFQVSGERKLLFHCKDNNCTMQNINCTLQIGSGARVLY